MTSQLNQRRLRPERKIKSMKNRNISFATIPLALTLTCFTLSPPAQAVCQEGCLTSENTVLGDDALLNTTGGANTAIGFDALLSNTTGSNNTAIGWCARLQHHWQRQHRERS